MLEKGIPRQGYKLLSKEGAPIGHVSSGTHSPSLDIGIGIAYVALPWASVGSEILVDIRGRHFRAQVCPTPFVGAK